MEQKIENAFRPLQKNNYPGLMLIINVAEAPGRIKNTSLDVMNLDAFGFNAPNFRFRQFCSL